jgi:spermidine/putrescine transport system permease protein
MNWLKRSFQISVYLFLYVPIIVLVAYSLNKAQYSLEWHGFTTLWYSKLLANGLLWKAFINSLQLGLIASFIACGLSFFASIKLMTSRSHTRTYLINSILLFLIIPDLIFAVGLLLFFNLAKIPLGFTSLLIAHVTFCIPFAVILINTKLATIDDNIYRAAIDLSASYSTIVTQIFLPLLWPSLLSAFLLCFTLSFDDIVISYFIAGPEYDILPLQIYSLIKTGITPEINALCSILFVLSLLLILAAHALQREK